MSLYVNDEKVDPAEIQAEFRRLLPSYNQYADPAMSREERDRQLTEWSRENVIERMLVRQHAATMEADTQVLDERLKLLLDQTVSSISPPTDEEIRAYYDANPDLFVEQEMVRASHIVKHLRGEDEFGLVEKEMNSMLEKLKSGESFEALAMRNSDCPTNAGDLGFFPRGHMVQEFENVVFAMEPGETSGVFRTEFGYHIAKVHERKAAKPVNFEDVVETIREHLLNQIKQEAVDQFVDQLKKSAIIEERP